jgi:hypothetical protein
VLAQRQPLELRAGVAVADGLAVDGLAVAGQGDVRSEVARRGVEVERLVEGQCDTQKVGRRDGKRAGQ